MTKKRWWIILVLGVFVIGAAGYKIASTKSPEEKAERERIAVYKKQRNVGDLKVGDEAPDFKLESAGQKEVVQLSSFEGKRDVVLIFGSYT